MMKRRLIRIAISFPFEESTVQPLIYALFIGSCQKVTFRLCITHFRGKCAFSFDIGIGLMAHHRFENVTRIARHIKIFCVAMPLKPIKGCEFKEYVGAFVLPVVRALALWCPSQDQPKEITRLVEPEILKIETTEVQQLFGSKLCRIYSRYKHKYRPDVYRIQPNAQNPNRHVNNDALKRW